MENFTYVLAALACPVGMGLMMWMMMRGNKGQESSSAPPPARPSGASPALPPAADPGSRLAELHAQLGEIQAQQQQIAAQIARLSAEGQPATDQTQPAKAQPARKGTSGRSLTGENRREPGPADKQATVSEPRGPAR